MRIAHFYGHRDTTGVTISLLDVARHLEERGHVVHVICRYGSALMDYHRHLAFFHLAGLYKPFLRTMLKRLLHKQRIEVLHVHSRRDCKLAMAVARELGIPTCYSCHEVSEGDCQDARLADRAIAVSAGVGDFLRERFDIHPPVLQVIPNGVNMRTLPADPRPVLRRESDFAEDELWIGFLGRIAEKKNVDGLVRAFARVTTELPALRLAIMGAGPDERAVRQLAAELRLTERIRFTGWLPGDKALRITGGLDALVLPSRCAEGLSCSLLAAMAMGVPVLATDIPSLAGGPVTDGVTGWLCDPTDDSLADGLRRLVAAGPDGRTTIGAAARAEIDRNYCMDRQIDQLEAAYQEAIHVQDTRGR